MNGVGHPVDALVGGQAFSFSGIGVLVAVGLLVALRLALPDADRGRVRVPFWLLVLHLGLVATTALVDAMPGVAAIARGAALVTLLVCLARAGFLLVVDALIVRRFARPIPKIFRDILEGLLYSAVVLVVLRQAGARLDALLTTSALLTAVIGLSLQDTLGNLFAGLSIQAQNPFEVGDWIQYDEDPELVGRVIEINWRATRVVTLDDVEVVIPNGPLARAPIRNFTKPTRVSRRSLFVVVAFSEPPHRVQRTIVEAIERLEGVVAVPAPSVVTREFVERGVRYWIRYYTDDFARRETTDGLVRDRVWYALRRASIAIAVPSAELGISHDDESARTRARSEALASRIGALRNVDFLRMLDDEQRESLARAAHERPYAASERVIREGEAGDELFIVQDGEVAVLIGEGAGEVEVARLGAGSFFGEMSLMTGEPRTASVRAAIDTRLLVNRPNSRSK